MRRSLSLVTLSRALFFCGVLLFSSLPLPAFAQSDEDSKPALPLPSDSKPALQIGDFQDNNIIHYDGSRGGQCTTVGSKYTKDTSLPNLSGSDNAEKIWNFLIEQGLTDEQAAGIMGNIHQESGYDPNLQEGNGIGYGIVQWSFGRRTQLQDAADLANVPVSDLSFQLGFMMNELKTLPIVNWRDLVGRFNISNGESLWDVILRQETIEDSMVLFHDGFERSGDYSAYGGLDHRLKFAEQAYEKFSGKKVARDSTKNGMACRSQSAAGSGDLIATLLEYAHPEYHEPKFITMMPGYEAAVKTARSEGRGVGGIQHPGIDCAGFVSLLIVDSGFDPEYNSKGMYATPGSTGEAIQRSWMEQNWESIGKGGDINVADLRPGDVAVTRQGSGEHIFLHVGEIDGFDNIFASASLDTRAPMAAGSYENAVDPAYDWFRKK